MTTSEYLLDNRAAAAQRRFGALSALFDDVTFRHVEALGIQRGWRCWEVGADGPSVPNWLADRVGPDGHVLATDIDTSWIDGVAPHVEVRRHDIARDDLPSGMFDLIQGVSQPLGATWEERGTNFALFSEVAEAVDLCLFDLAGNETRIALTEVDSYVWHGFVPGVHQGQRYGYRVHGQWDPVEGRVCNPHKLLLDPYAKAVCGAVSYDDALFGYKCGFSAWRPSTTDSAPHTVRSVVINPAFDWENDRPPRIAYPDSVIYEVHVRSLTRTHPGIPPELRGTYAGLAHPAMIDYLQRLGVTAVGLMPVHQFVSEHAGFSRDLPTYYWGFNTIGYFAPHNGYSAAGDDGGQVDEFKTMVKTLHAAGIEVLIDVVYNHTGEGDHLGPTLCFRGIDNAAYYRLQENDPRYNVDFSGCGNCLDTRHPQVLALVMDSLRYWITEMHVDGFRFDLASVLARELHTMNRLSAFFDLVQQDPDVSQVKLIAEPWDVGEGGYQIGNFPPLWTEWNGKYRDEIRDFWRDRHRTLREFAVRLTGSSDLYQHYSRRPLASVNTHTTRTTRFPGSTGRPARRTTRNCWTTSARSSSCAPSTRCSGGGVSFAACRELTRRFLSAMTTAEETSPGSPPRAARWPMTTGTPRAGPWRSSSTATRSPSPIRTGGA